MTAARSQNGYTANTPADVKRYTVPGTQVGLTVRKGSAATVLLYVAEQFDQRVENIDNARGALDDWGYAERPIRGSATTLSNHASGTAIDLNATRHPLGTDPRANYTPAQLTEIHTILAECSGVIRWGGDYAGRKDPMHFEVNAGAARVIAAAAVITARRAKAKLRRSLPHEVPWGANAAFRLTVGRAGPRAAAVNAALGLGGARISTKTLAAAAAWLTRTGHKAELARLHATAGIGRGIYLLLAADTLKRST